MTSACCGRNRCGHASRLDYSQSVDEEIESLAFSICNIDSNPGLSWAEIEECEVSFFFFPQNLIKRSAIDSELV